MSDTVVYFRGPQSAIGVLPLSDPKFLEDAAAVLEMPEDQFAALEEALTKSDGFLSHPELLNIVGNMFADRDAAERATGYIVILDRFFRESAKTLSSFHDMFAEQLEEKCKESLSAEQRVLLIQRSKRLIANQPALARQWKAGRLSLATGQKLEEFRVICDLRPVFSADRATIEGMIPLTTIKVVATDHNGLPTCLETVVSERQLEDLEQSIVKARKKIDALRSLLATKGVAMPALSGSAKSKEGGA